jgi:hypothetical protein
MSNCKCAYKKTWKQKYERIEYKFVGGEKFSGRVKATSWAGKTPGWTASASDGNVEPSADYSGGDGYVSTNLSASDWLVKKDWEEDGGPYDVDPPDGKEPCEDCKPLGKPVRNPGMEKPANDTPGDQKNVTVTFKAYTDGSQDTCEKNCKTKERKVRRTDSFSQEYDCEPPPGMPD